MSVEVGSDDWDVTVDPGTDRSWFGMTRAERPSFDTSSRPGAGRGG
jgi:hypothetical protein